MRTMIVVAAGLLAAGPAFAQAQEQPAQPPEPQAQEQPAQPQDQQAQAQQQEAGQQLSELQTSEKEPFGQYLTDAQGRALYMFTADQKDAQQSACTGDCAQAWPPAIAQGQPKLGENVDQSKLGTIQREGGASQVTYNGWPLYYFVQDTAAGQVAGQDKQGFGGEWYVIGTDGEPIKKSEQKAEAGEEPPTQEKPQ